MYPEPPSVIFLNLAFKNYHYVSRYLSHKFAVLVEKIACMLNSDQKISKPAEGWADSVSRLNAIIQTAIDGIIIIDERGTIESVNPAAAKLFMYDAKELEGKNITVLMPSPYREEHDGYLSNYHKTGERRIIGIGREVTGLKKNDVEFPIRLAVSEMWLGEQRFYTGIVHDLTDVKAAEAEIRRLNLELEEKVAERTEELAQVVNRLLTINKQFENEIAERKKLTEALLLAQEELKAALEKERELNELKTRFVSMASHEFRTPLSTILSSVSLIGRYEQTEQQPQRDKHIEKIKSSVNNLTGILNDFLSLSKLEEGRVDCQPVEFELHQFCGEMIEEIKGLLKPGQQIFYQLPPHEVVVFLDKRHLKNILFNLVTNAIKYSDNGKPIYCSAVIFGDRFEIQVRDEGMGIPEEDQPHLFTRFFRANNAINIQGTGLGLNIVRRYVELMKGKIEFSSQLGAGSSFTIRLPIRL